MRDTIKLALMRVNFQIKFLKPKCARNINGSCAEPEHLYNNKALFNQTKLNSNLKFVYDFYLSRKKNLNKIK